MLQFNILTYPISWKHSPSSDWVSTLQVSSPVLVQISNTVNSIYNIFSPSNFTYHILSSRIFVFNKYNKFNSYSTNYTSHSHSSYFFINNIWMIIPRLQTCKRCLSMYYDGRVLNNIVGTLSDIPYRSAHIFVWQYLSAPLCLSPPCSVSIQTF